jgi:hypothetical protein
MHGYKETKGPANPGILVIDGCHPNHLGHAAICGLPLMALITCYLLHLDAQDLFKHSPPKSRATRVASSCQSIREAPETGCVQVPL